MQQQYEEALTQDASVFDYDGVYDSLQQARVQPRQQEKVERQSRYIAQLKDQAEQRKREADVSYERRWVENQSLKALLSKAGRKGHLFSEQWKSIFQHPTLDLPEFHRNSLFVQMGSDFTGSLPCS